MNSCTVIVLMCLLSAQAAPRSIRNSVKISALNAGVEDLRKEIKTILGHLDEPGQLPNISCRSLNFTELVVPNQRLTVKHLSTFRCYLLKMSKQTPELENKLMEVIQRISDFEQFVTGQPINQDCNLPPLHQDMYFNVKCVLKLLDQRLSTATFSF